MTLILTAPVPVPVPGVCPSQAASSLTLQLRVPPPVLLILSVCAAGFPPPWVAANDSVVGLAPMAGGTGAAATVKATGMVTGLAAAAERDGAAMGAHG